jgi:hypothetical protein
LNGAWPEGGSIKIDGPASLPVAMAIGHGGSFISGRAPIWAYAAAMHRVLRIKGNAELQVFDPKVEGGRVHIPPNGPDAAELPAGGGHIEDKVMLDAILRGEVFLHVLEKFVKRFGILGLQNDSAGAKAVFEGIAGGFCFAFGSDGAARLGPVFARGFGARFLGPGGRGRVHKASLT